MGRRGIDPLFDGDPARPVHVAQSGPGLLELLGVELVAGRPMGTEDARAGAPPVALLTRTFWMSQFGGDPGVLGRAIRLGQRRVRPPVGGGSTVEIDLISYTVIGIVDIPRGPLFSGVQVILPWSAESSATRDNRMQRDVILVGRLRHGVTVEEAQAELDAIGARLQQEYSGELGADFRPHLVSLHEDTLAAVPGARPALLALLGATWLILLIAVTNIANLLLARGSARRSELSVRAALGAGRGGLTRLLMTESLLLALPGGIGGLLLGSAGVGALVAVAPGWIPRLPEVSLDGTVLAIAAAVTLGSGLLFGVAPVLFLRRTLMLQGRQPAVEPDDGRSWVRSGLVVTQLALSLVLLSGAGLMVRSF
jgi:putative ABC transport system permease protein